MSKIRLLSIIVLSLSATVLLVTGSCSYITGESPAAAVMRQTQTVLFKDVSPAEAYAIIGANAGHADFTIIDVRTPEEYASGHLPGAINRNLNSPTFKDDINKLDKNNTYLVYCSTGVRSAAARDIMKTLGFTDIYNMKGGITAWIDGGFPVVK